MTHIDLNVDYEQALRVLDGKIEDLKPVLQAALREGGKKAKKDFESITKTWKHSVDVDVLTEIRQSGVTLIVGTDDKVFGWLERGTRPHYIVAKNAKALGFRSGFHPKTTVGHIGSGFGGTFGAMVHRPWVLHPGTKPRRWIPKITTRARKVMDGIVRSHLRRWAK